MSKYFTSNARDVHSNAQVNLDVKLSCLPYNLNQKRSVHKF